LIDTVYLALGQMRKASNPRRALLVVSDGIDNHSRYSKGQLLRAAIEADVQIYTIILNTGAGGQSTGVPYRSIMVAKPIDQARQRQESLLLDELAEKTGGLHCHVRNPADAMDAAVEVGRAIRNTYVITYRAPDSDMSGKWRRIAVKVHAPDVSVHARAGYYSR
jgi:Ca-activated chloride channel family protein